MKFAAIICLSFFALVVVSADSNSDKEPTDCERDREKSKKSTVHMKIIFECDENGDYMALQCFQNSKFCVCFNKEGHMISTMSAKLKSCECTREADIAKSKGPGEFVPACDEDGYYSKKQCHPSRGKCWCVDKSGKKTTSETSDPLSC